MAERVGAGVGEGVVGASVGAAATGAELGTGLAVKAATVVGAAAGRSNALRAMAAPPRSSAAPTNAGSRNAPERRRADAGRRTGTGPAPSRARSSAAAIAAAVG